MKNHSHYSQSIESICFPFDNDVAVNAHLLLNEKYSIHHVYRYYLNVKVDTVTGNDCEHRFLFTIHGRSKLKIKN